MRWPCVSRDRHDWLLGQHDLRCAEVVEARKRAERAEVRYDELVALIAERGLNPVPTIPAVLPIPEKREPSPIEVAIREQAGGDEKTARWLWGRARAMRLEGKSDGDIVNELGKWITSEDIY